MTKMTKGRKSFETAWFWLGAAVTLLTMLPNLILGENAVYTYHDQLDGELMSYILQARHLFSGDVLPEFMGGASKTALTMPAPLCVLLFLNGNALGALTVMQLLGRLAGFAGMYLLVRETGGRPWAGAGAGLLYGFLPFLPVYGLSQYGIPLLFWSGLQLRKGERLVLAYCCTALYGLTSSLVLVGFCVLGMGLIVFVWDLCRKKRSWHFLAAWQLLLLVYAAENFRLLGQLAGLGGGMVSHKTEYVLHGESFPGGLVQGLFYGGQHSEGYQGLLLLAGAAGAVLLAAASGAGAKRAESTGLGAAGDGESDICCGRDETARLGEDETDRLGAECRKHCRGQLGLAGICLGWNLGLAAAAAFWNSGMLTGLRGSLGALGAFQFDRVLWAAPCLWYLATAAVVSAAAQLWRSRRAPGRLAAGACLALVAAAAGITGIRILLAGDIKNNVQKLRNPDYGMLSYSDYYAIGVMEQVKDFLAGKTGLAQDGYRVASLGIDPAAALYHGFYCLDGYSNNYSLAYKHAFRRIIRPELEKSEYLRAYYDEWGNRCYLYSSEVPGYVTIEKHGFYFQKLELDTEALRDMGCRYILSAAYIQNAGEQGLALMNETPFETEGSYYCIYVYEVGGEGGV